MNKLKVLNLRSGLGGNRKLWKNVQVTSVEINQTIGNYYKEQFPSDNLIIGDARKYLLNHFREFDFIWSSDPCPTHSRARFWSSKGGKCDPVYPDLSLYETIYFLKHYFDGMWIVENVKPFYEPLLTPTKKIGRHLFWSNFNIGEPNFQEADIKNGKIEDYQNLFGFDLTGHKFDIRKDKILRNCVHPETGKYILDCARGTMQDYQTEQRTIFQDLEEFNN